MSLFSSLMLGGSVASSSTATSLLPHRLVQSWSLCFISSLLWSSFLSLAYCLPCGGRLCFDPVRSLAVFSLRCGADCLDSVLVSTFYRSDRDLFIALLVRPRSPLAGLDALVLFVR
ncbi:hypothetical protein ISN44_As01g012870 [Arabidopsis suecica]|uniref:Uncharacterized protein n=1 Tax=Arabidopsis suecica TaxID=45249 RepID=A0A8T2H1V6_ARASU|nr:hypothetical protein ISN44_As01g012870 [Arabidopsis suecica]